jgi:uncharacterized LabA/DUF88 family protein
LVPEISFQKHWNICQNNTSHQHFQNQINRVSRVSKIENENELFKSKESEDKVLPLTASSL